MLSIRRMVFSVQSAIVEAAPIVLPSLIGGVMQAGFRDSRIGKIVGGIGLMISGFSLMVASGAIKMGSWRWERLEAGEWETTRRKVLRSAGILLGFTGFCFGAYCVASGAFELYQGTSDSSFDLRQVKESLLRCPEAKSLWKEAEKRAGPISMQWAPKDEISSFTLIDPKGNPSKVFLKPTRRLSELFSNLLIELNNVRSGEDFNTLHRGMCFRTPSEYREETQRIEWQSLSEAFRVFDTCSKRNVWPDSFSQEREFLRNLFTHRWPTEKEYLEEAGKSEHGAFCEKQWREICAAPHGEL